jgi:hypothetical protein
MLFTYALDIGVRLQSLYCSPVLNWTHHSCPFFIHWVVVVVMMEMVVVGLSL